MITLQTKEVRSARRGRNRGLVNLSRMGHCAPAVMQTLLDMSTTQAPWLVRLAAGLPGGIGNTGRECGGITAPLVMLGLRHAADPERRGVPMIVHKGHNFLERFKGSFRTPLCEEIRGRDRLPLTCINVIRRAPELFAQTLSSGCEDALSPEQIEAYSRLHAYFIGRGFRRGFHCAHEVLHRLRGSVPVNRQLLDATSAFVGGTVYAGMSCSAFVAGVMALGLALGEIENSRLRVLRMIGKMAMGGDAFADDLNAFNRMMNRGHWLGEWFRAKFGSTVCSEITECDFSKADEGERFIEADGASGCIAIAQDVAHEVQAMIRSGREGSLEEKAV